MLYQEFLRLTGATAQECELTAYQKYVEPAYMNNDDLFPTKDEVVEHWQRFGLLGFTKEAITALKQAVCALRATTQSIYFQYPSDGMRNLVDFIFQAAKRN